MNSHKALKKMQLDQKIRLRENASSTHSINYSLNQKTMQSGCSRSPDRKEPIDRSISPIDDIYGTSDDLKFKIKRSPMITDALAPCGYLFPKITDKIMGNHSNNFKSQRSQKTQLDNGRWNVCPFPHTFSQRNLFNSQTQAKNSPERNAHNTYANFEGKRNSHKPNT